MDEIKKLCVTCKIEKPLNDFYNDKKGKYGKARQCKICTGIRKKKEYENNKEHMKLKSNENFKKRYVKKERDIENIIGMRVGRLVVIEFVESVKNYGVKWKCKCDCGNEVNVFRKDLTKKQNPTRSCGCLVADVNREKFGGSNNRLWKGGEPTVDGKGYLTFRHGELRGVKQHRYIYEQHYGIKLLPHQNIHHINGIRTDNRIENLELWDTSQPSGQRIEDKIEFYFSILNQYKNHPLYKDIIDEQIKTL